MIYFLPPYMAINPPAEHIMMSSPAQSSSATPTDNGGAPTSNKLMSRHRTDSSGSNPILYSPSNEDSPGLEYDDSHNDSNNYLLGDDDDEEDYENVKATWEAVKRDSKSAYKAAERALEAGLDALAPGEQQRSVDESAGHKFDLCGSMWKRRGGLGRNAEVNWVMRCFTLYGPILCYHEEPDIDSVTDPSRPRARLNLSKTETIAEMHSKQKPGLPSEDLLTINIYDPIIHAKRKWEMCCTSKEQQLVWYKAINAYDGNPRDTTTGGVAEFDTKLSPLTSTRKTQLPELSNDNNTESRVRPPSRNGGAVMMMDDVELIAKAAAKAAEILSEKQVRQETAMSNYTVALSIVVLNVAIYFVRNGSEQTYKMTVFFVNAFVLYIAFQHVTPGREAPRRGPKARAEKKKRTIYMDEGKAHPVRPELETQRSFAKPLRSGATIARAAPTKNSELERMLETHEHNSPEAIRAYAAAPTSSIRMEPHSYANTDATSFNLRIGPNYKKNKQKAPSGRALYDLVSMDFLYADTSLKNTADKFRIPSIPGMTDISTGHAHIPPMMIINTWLPGEEPSMFAKNTDGETYSIPMVFVLSKDTLEQLKDTDNASPGVKLLSEWCRRAETEPDFRGRFKCMGMIENIESTGVPKFIQGYNGKPALVTKSGTFKRHANYIEFSINVNMWAFLARKGLHTLTPTFPDFIFNVGFTIEARKDEEMPEVLLGGCRLLNLDPEKAVVDGVDDVDI